MLFSWATLAKQSPLAYIEPGQKKMYHIPGNAIISFLISSPTVDSKVDAFFSLAIIVGTARKIILQFGTVEMGIINIKTKEEKKNIHTVTLSTREK